MADGVVVDGVVDDKDVENSANWWLMLRDCDDDLAVQVVRGEKGLGDNETKAATERIPPDRRIEPKRPVMAKECTMIVRMDWRLMLIMCVRCAHPLLVPRCSSPSTVVPCTLHLAPCTLYLVARVNIK